MGDEKFDLRVSGDSGGHICGILVRIFHSNTICCCFEIIEQKRILIKLSLFIK